MSDDATKIILGDTAISAAEQPRRGIFGRRRKDRQPMLTHCENCGAPLHGPWCALCGQPAIDYRRSFRHVIVDVLDSFLNWDSKFFATIGWLMVSPWRLTNEFLAGRRVRYLHPLRLYLLASILFFFAINYGAKSIHFDASKMSAGDRADLSSELKKEDIPAETRAKIDKALKLERASPMPNPKDSPESQISMSPLPAEVKDELKKTATDEDNSLIKFDTPPTDPFGQWLQARAKEKLGEHGTNLQLFLLGLFNNLPYMMFCCIPLFAFVLRILYLGRRIFYIDHLVYALHIHSFFYVATITISFITIGLNRIAPSTLAGWIVGLLWCAFAVQIFLSIRRVYRQSWFFSIFKFFVGGFAYFIVLCLALAVTFLITLALP